MVRSARMEEGVYRRNYGPEISRANTQMRMFRIRLEDGHGGLDTVAKMGVQEVRLRELTGELAEMVMEAWAPFERVWGRRGWC